MPRDERDAAGELAVGHRDPGVGRSGDAGGHARHDLELDARLPQHQRLLAAATEHQRVAALEPHDPAPGAAVLDEQPVDLRLRHLRPAALLADVDELGIRARVPQRLRRDQAVVEDDVGRGDQLDRADGEQAGVARPGPDEVDGHASASACASSSPAPAASIRRASASPSASGSSSATHADPSGNPTKPRIVPSLAWIPTGV